MLVSTSKGIRFRNFYVFIETDANIRWLLHKTPFQKDDGSQWIWFEPRRIRVLFLLFHRIRFKCYSEHQICFEQMIQWVLNHHPISCMKGMDEFDQSCLLNEVNSSSYALNGTGIYLGVKSSWNVKFFNASSWVEASYKFSSRWDD